MKYDVILADPPWNYNNSGCRGAAENEYPTMATDDICNLPVRSLATNDCVLFLWCTWPQSPDGLKVMEAWGFRYITGFPWVKITGIANNLWGDIEIKVPYGVGFWARGCTEFLMIGTIGKVSPPSNGFIGLLSPNLFHSRKPESVYEFAEAIPGERIELFARRPREGWHIWGNEVISDIQIGEGIS